MIIVPHPYLPPSIPPSIHPSMWAYPIEPKITKRWLFCLLSPLLHSLSCAFHDQSERRRLQLFLHQIPSFAFSASSLVRPFSVHSFSKCIGRERERERDWETKQKENGWMRGIFSRDSDSNARSGEISQRPLVIYCVLNPEFFSEFNSWPESVVASLVPPLQIIMSSAIATARSMEHMWY